MSVFFLYPLLNHWRLLFSVLRVEPTLTLPWRGTLRWKSNPIPELSQSACVWTYGLLYSFFSFHVQRAAKAFCWFFFFPLLSFHPVILLLLWSWKRRQSEDNIIRFVTFRHLKWCWFFVGLGLLEQTEYWFVSNFLAWLLSLRSSFNPRESQIIEDWWSNCLRSSFLVPLDTKEWQFVC